MEIVFIQMITDGLSNMLGLHWDFHSLLLAIQMMFSFMLVDETSSLKLCPNCYKAFFTENEEDVYCSKECKIKDK
ncbi:MAG: hypothetical protein IJB59_14555 [Oscillospiraceae bacterium]|nr:hypothetical protein [Oscillospiraceae bacterium]